MLESQFTFKSIIEKAHDNTEHATTQDEETLLTENSVRGILNFVSDGRHDFGQGLVTYASSALAFKSRLQAFQYRICTVADSFRVADDMGKLRCQFKVGVVPITQFKEL